MCDAHETEMAFKQIAMANESFGNASVFQPLNLVCTIPLPPPPPQTPSKPKKKMYLRRNFFFRKSYKKTIIQ